MSKNFKNPLQIFNVCLFAGVLGLTYMNTSYIPAKQASEKVTIYVAAEDINPNVDLTSSMFVPTTINKADLLPGYITDVAVLENVYSNTNIYKNEPLMVSRVRETVEVEGNYEIKLEPNFSGKLEKKDVVQVFVQLVNKDTGEVSVYSLFDRKQIQNIEFIDSSVNTISGLYVNVTEDELKDYYKAKEKGSIIIGKITNDNTTKVEKIDFNSEAYLNATSQTETINQQTVQSVVVNNGDTLESIATKYGTTVEAIQEVNLGLETLTVGQSINVPTHN